MDEQIFGADLDIEKLAIGDEVVFYGETDDDCYLAEVVHISEDKSKVTVKPAEAVEKYVPIELDADCLYLPIRFLKNGTQVQFVKVEIDEVEIEDEVAKETDDNDIIYGDIKDINVEEKLVTVEWDDGDITTQEIDEIYKVIETPEEYDDEEIE